MPSSPPSTLFQPLATPPASSLTAATEKRFLAIASKNPVMTRAEIEQSLAISPAIPTDWYYSWHAEYLDRKYSLSDNNLPMSEETTGNLLKTTKYDDPVDLRELKITILFPPRMSRLPLGYYVDDTQRKQYCFLDFVSTYLPQDGPAQDDHIAIQAIPSTNITGLPYLFVTIGALCVASDATARCDAEPTNFVVVVATDRKVHILFSPLGPDPEYCGGWDDDATDDEKEQELQGRPKTGKLPAFSTPFSSALLAANIDDLINTDVVNKPLDVSGSNLVVVDDRTTVKFRDMDSGGWMELNGEPTAFAQLQKSSILAE